MDDFQPAKVAQQITPLRKLLELRSSFANLRSSLIGNEKLDNLLQEMIQNQEILQQAGVRSWYPRQSRRRRTNMAAEPKPARKHQRRPPKQPPKAELLDRIAEEGRIGQSPGRTKSAESVGSKIWYRTS